MLRINNREKINNRYTMNNCSFYYDTDTGSESDSEDELGLHKVMEV